jgi:phospholipase C
VASGGYSWKTYPELLSAAGVSWKMYQQNDRAGYLIRAASPPRREAVAGNGSTAPDGRAGPVLTGRALAFGKRVR